MLRALRVIHTKVIFVPAPRFSILQRKSESMSRPTSSNRRSYSAQHLPHYDYDLVVVGGGSGGNKEEFS